MSEKIKICKTIVNNIVQRKQYFISEGKISQDEEYLDGVLKYLKSYSYENHYTLMETFSSERELVGKNETWYNERNQILEEKSGFQKCIYEYREDQRCSRIQKFNWENNIENTLVYNYSENDEHMRNFNSLGILIAFTITKYNENRKPVRITHFERPENIRDNIVELDGFKEFYEMMKVFKFDLLENEIDVQLSMDYFIDDVFYEYDKFGNEVSCETFHHSEETFSDNLVFLNGDYNFYNDNNLLIKRHMFEIKTDWDDETLLGYEYILDEKGSIIEKITNCHSNRFVEKFNYNKQGKLISYTENRNDSEELTEILYDDFGNKFFKIVKRNYDDEYDEEITKYEIEYY